MRYPALWLTATMLLASSTAASARPPRAELVGLRLGMSEEVARESLARRGAPLPENRGEPERGEQESWSLKRGPWSYVAFGVGNDRVRWVTAFARRTGPRIRYRDLGSLDGCRRTGTYFFTWNVPPVGDAHPYSVIARGTDSVYVTSVSLVRDARDTNRDHSAAPDSDR